MEKLIMGIDEAGRGPVIGPMIICGVMMEKKDIPKLVQIGVKDSKLLSPVRREKLKVLIEKIAQRWDIVKISASQIDRYGMTYLHLKGTVELINSFSPHTAIIDCPTRFPASYKRKIEALMKNKEVRLVVENFADKNHCIVSAASVLAKVVRDKEIENISLLYKDIGSGYPSDKRTVKFLRRYLKENRQLPDIVRKRWQTIQNLIRNNKNNDK